MQACITIDSNAGLRSRHIQVSLLDAYILFTRSVISASVIV